MALLINFVFFFLLLSHNMTLKLVVKVINYKINTVLRKSFFIKRTLINVKHMDAYTGNSLCIGMWLLVVWTENFFSPNYTIFNKIVIDNRITFFFLGFKALLVWTPPITTRCNSHEKAIPKSALRISLRKYFNKSG